MKIRFDLEIDPREVLRVEPEEFLEEFLDVRNIEELEFELLDRVEPCWRVEVDREDLQELWEKIQELRERE